MPELPEVEAMRQTLLSLVSSDKMLSFKFAHNDKLPRTFITSQDLEDLSGKCFCVDILRKGKLLCMVLDLLKPGKGKERRYLFLHMGMTGRISSPSNIPSLESLKKSDEYPPPHTHLIFTIADRSGKVSAEVCFSDPRKFGSVELKLDMEARFDELATDALGLDDEKEKDRVVSGLVGQPLAIKAILLDQRRVVSGIGNWVADEVLYQSRLHPDQQYLTQEEGTCLVETLSYVLKTAVACKGNEECFPKEWIFHQRWATKRVKVKDFRGRSIAFIQSASRTSAIVPSIQKRKSRNRMTQTKVRESPDADEPKVKLNRRSKRGK